MLKQSEGMEPRFISWNAAALHFFEFTLPDVWSRKKIKDMPLTEPDVSAGHWNDLYSPAHGQSRLRWLRRKSVVILELEKKSRGGINLTVDEVAPHGEEPIEILVNDEVF